jgi:preprotein translocase subunit SecG
MLRMGLTIIQLFAAIAIIALVLLQRGKGADAGAGFGAGASGTVFGARGARTALSRATAIFAAIFMVNSLALAYMGTRGIEVKPKTLLDEAAQTAPATGGAPTNNIPAPATTPAPTTNAPAIGTTPSPEVPPAAEAPQSGAQAPATTTPAPEQQQ